MVLQPTNLFFDSSYVTQWCGCVCVRLQFVTPYHSSLYFNTRIRVGIHIIVVDIVKQHLPCRRLEGLVLHRSTDIIGSKSFQYSTTLSTNPTYLTNVVRKGVEEVL